MGWFDSLSKRDIKALIKVDYVDVALDKYTVLSPKGQKDFKDLIDHIISKNSELEEENGIAKLDKSWRKATLKTLAYFPNLIHFKLVLNLETGKDWHHEIPENLWKYFIEHKDPAKPLILKGVTFNKKVFRKHLKETFHTAAHETKNTADVREYAKQGLRRLQYGNFWGKVFYHVPFLGAVADIVGGIPGVFTKHSSSVSQPSSVGGTARPSSPSDSSGDSSRADSDSASEKDFIVIPGTCPSGPSTGLKAPVPAATTSAANPVANGALLANGNRDKAELYDPSLIRAQRSPV